MQFAHLGIQMLVFVGIAVCATVPRLRYRVAAGLLAVGVLCGVELAVGGVATRTLEITHRFSAYVELQVQSREFPIETVTAGGGTWAYISACFCALWAAVVVLARDRAHAFAVPLGLAWTGVACQLLLEKAAGPEILLAPFDLAPDRVLLPATLACAFLLARRGRKIVHLFLYLSLFIAVTRLPLALFGTLATRGEWGTHLDVHGTVFFVPPGGATTIGPIEVAAGGTEQLFWLIWAPHLIVYPLFYMMSAGSLGFLRLMWQRQKEADHVADHPARHPSPGATSS